MKSERIRRDVADLEGGSNKRSWTLDDSWKGENNFSELFQTMISDLANSILVTMTHNYPTKQNCNFA